MSAATIIFARADLSIPGTAAISSVATTRWSTSKPISSACCAPAIPTSLFSILVAIRRWALRRYSSFGDSPRSRYWWSAIQAILQCGNFGSPALPSASQRLSIFLCLMKDCSRSSNVTQRQAGKRSSTPEAFDFAGFIFYPHRDLLAAANGATLSLTTSESRLLQHFVSHPWQLCPRPELAVVLHGKALASDRAIDIVINRLRRKLVALSGSATRTLIKTEFRRGYRLVAGVSKSIERRETDAAA